MERTFRISFKKVFRFSVSIGIGLFFLFIVLALISLFTSGFSLLSFFEGLLIAVILPLFVVSLITFLVFFLGFLFPIKVNPDIISATNYWGKRHKFYWNELNHVELADASGVTYIVFSNKQEKKIWVPILIGDLDLFLDFVLEKTELLNPDFHKNFANLIDGEEAAE